MWEKVAAWLKFLWDAGKQSEDNREDIKTLAEDQTRLFRVVQILSNENYRLRDELRHERELRERDRSERERDLRELKLELRLQIAEELRRLSPAKDE
jgi:hypothetical protein